MDSLTNDGQLREKIVSDSIETTLFSWSAQKGLNPLCIKEAKGSYLYDFSGQKYLDFSSQLMNMNLGHNHPKIVEGIKKQCDEVVFVHPGMTTKVRAELGKKMQEISPIKNSKTFFVNGGADAVENAIKIARIYSGKYKILSKYRSYHGATYGSMIAGGDPRRHLYDRDGMTGVVHFEDPFCYRCPWGQDDKKCQNPNLCVDHLERVIEFQGPKTIAAIIMEGESGTSGCIKYPPHYFQNVRKLCDKYGILLIADEVMSGFCRTGKWFGVQNFDVEPDIVTIAKGLTGGHVPMGGVIVSEKIAKHFDENPFVMGLTYSSHPLASAAAVASIEAYQQENIPSRVYELGLYVNERVKKMKEKHPSLGDFRNTGLLGCIELVKNKETKEELVKFNSSGPDAAITGQIFSKLKELGIFTFVRWNYIFIAPPLNISQSDLDFGLDAIDKVLDFTDSLISK